jgi:phenol 2-monooxygenase
LAVTDFPDIRFKSLIQSDGQVNIVLIPREGGYLARYIYRAGQAGCR